MTFVMKRRLLAVESGESDIWPIKLVELGGGVSEETPARVRR